MDLAVEVSVTVIKEESVNILEHRLELLLVWNYYLFVVCVLIYWIDRLIIVYVHDQLIEQIYFEYKKYRFAQVIDFYLYRQGEIYGLIVIWSSFL